MSAASTADQLLEALWSAKGTDLMLTAGLEPTVRVDGELVRMEGTSPLTPDDTERLLDELLNDRQRAAFAEGHEIDFSFTWRGTARLRGNGFRQRGSVGLALRLIPHEVPTLEELGLPKVVSDFTELRQGLVLVTGPTGSGKSTSLAAMIDRINSTQRRHILTIEDPIEYVHDHKLSAVNQREVGTDTASFPDAMRNALREDPDVLLVGEMRDLESISFALSIAETGHLVFATLHTNDSAQALDRIIDVFPGDRQPQIRVQLASVLTGVVYQRLLPRVDGGLVAAYEVLVANSAVRNLVKEGKTNQLRNQLVTGQRDGMVTLEQSLSELVKAGTVSYEEAAARSLHPKDITRA